MIDCSNKYCRLEIFCSLNINERKKIVVKNNLDFGKDVFVEKYEDFCSVKNRILELSQKWSNKYYSTDVYKSREEEKIYYTGNFETASVYKYPVFLLYNRWENFLLLGYCPMGWLAPLQFVIYSTKYYINSYGEEKGKTKILEIYQSSKEKNIVFLAPDWYTEPPSNLILEKTSDLFVIEWLDKGEVSEEYKQIIFQPEIEKRNKLLPIV